MVRKVRPRWGLEETHNVKDSSRRFDNISFEKVVALLGIENSYSEQDLFQSLVVAIDPFYFQYFDIPSPSNEEIKAALVELKKATERFEFCVSNLDFQSRRFLQSGFIRKLEEADNSEDIGLMSNYFYTERKKFSRMLTGLVAAIDLTRTRPKETRRGRKGNPAMQELVWQLAGVYENYTNRRAFEGFRFDPVTGQCGGPFFDFANYIVVSYAPELKLSNQAIGGYIRRVVGDLAK